MKNSFGVIGGMGPMASALFYEMLTRMTPAGKDQEHIRLVLLSDTEMPDRTAAIKAGDDSPAAKEVRAKLLEDAKQLEAMGCRGYCVTCNTAHYFMHRLESEVSIPLISMIREAAKEMARKYPGGKVAVMGTTGTLESGLYQEALAEVGVEAFVLSPEAQQATMSLIYDCVKAGKPADPALVALIDKEVGAKSFDAVLTACTELSVIKADGLFGEKYVDPMEILAARVIEFMKAE